MQNLRIRLKKLSVKYWPVIATLAIVIIFFWKFFIEGLIPIPGDFIVGVYHPWLDYKWGTVSGVPVKNPIMADVVSFSYPMRTLAIEQMKNGLLPLWNPYILTGIPLLANFQSAPFSFTNIFYFIFNTHTAWGIQIASQHFFALIFTYFLLRYWKLSKTASLFGGIAYAFSGYNVIWSQWNAHALVAAFIPLLILLCNKYFDYKNIKYLVYFALSLALQVFSGYPQGVIYSSVAVLLFTLFKFTVKEINFKNVVYVAIFAILGLLVASIQIFPAAELLANSQRRIEPLDYNWTFLPFFKIITFIAPDYFGNHSTGNYWGPQDYTSNTGFVGVTIVMLAFFSIVSFYKKNRNASYLIILLIASLLFSFPTPLSTFLWSNKILGFQAASAHRALVLFNLSLSMLAALGFDQIKYFKLKLKIIFIPATILFFYFAIAKISFWKTYLLSFATHPEVGDIQSVAFRNLIFPSLVFFGVVLTIFVLGKRSVKITKTALFIFLVWELFRFGWKYTPFSPEEYLYPDTPITTFLKNTERPFRMTSSDVIPVNLRMPYKIDSLDGYDAIYPERIANYIAYLNSGNINASTQGRYGTVDSKDSVLLNIANNKYTLALKRDKNNNISENGEIEKPLVSKDKYKKAYEDKTVVVLENTEVYPRTIMYFDYKVGDDKEILKKMLNGIDLDKLVYLDKDPNINPVPGKYETKYRMLNENFVLVDIETEGEGILFVSDNYYPGWNVYVDGNKRELLRANYTFRAVPVEKGKHRIEFKYEPNTFKYGLLLSGISAILLSVLCIIFVVLEKRNLHKYT